MPTMNWFTALHNAHPSQRGTYSIERLHALNRYCDEASLLRVMMVYIMLPMPAFLVATILEFIPLQDPHDGWKVNIGAWTRLGLIVLFVSLALLIQTREMVPLAMISIFKTMVISFSVTAAYLLIACGVASAWVFPIPFGYILLVPIFSCLLMVALVISIGPTAFRRNPTLWRQLRQQLGIIVVKTSLCGIYPVFSAIYFRLEPMHQYACVIFLPFIKIMMQCAIAGLSSHVEEHIPGITVFSVEVFNALYLTKCMQMAKSSATYLVIMCVDLIEAMIAFYDMQKQFSSVHLLVTQHNLTLSENNNLMALVLAACQEPDVFREEHTPSIRVRSTTNLRILKFLVTQTRPKKRASIAPQPCLNANAKEKEETCDSKRTFSTLFSPTAIEISANAKRAFIFRSLKLLFQCEYHVLVEYVECMIPILYCIYVLILYQLPSAKYYPEIRDMSWVQVESMVANVLIYASLEVLSLVLLHVVVKKKFGFSPVYVLAFVLENQAVELQARLIVWFAFVLQLTLVHFGESLKLKELLHKQTHVALVFDNLGVDFTLHFQWTKAQHAH